MSLAEILIILVVILVVLGPERLPELARMLGKGMREIRKASNMFRDTFMLEDQNHGQPTRPDQMMRSPEASPPTPDQSADPPSQPDTSVDRLAEHATPWSEFDTVDTIDLAQPARCDVTTRRHVSLSARQPPRDESQVELDPPLPPSVW
jgi:sec-independent protein translocase protein TatB